MAQEQTPPRALNRWELGSAAAVFLMGAFMAWQGLGYSVGSLNRMGPGFFPVAVGVFLMLVSVGIALEVRFKDTPAPDVPFRPLVAIVLGLVTFGVLIEPAGLVPATFLLVLLSAFGDRAMSPLRAILVAAAVSALGYGVFVLGFRLPLDAFW